MTLHPVHGRVRLAARLDLVGIPELEWALRLIVIGPATLIGSAIGRALAEAVL